MRAAQRLNEPPAAPTPEAAIGGPKAADPAAARPEPAGAPSSLAAPLDSGLTALAMVAGYYRIAADPAQLRHELALGAHAAGPEDLVRAAKRLNLKARLLTGKPRQAPRRGALSGAGRARRRRLRHSRRGAGQGLGQADRSAGAHRARPAAGRSGGADRRRIGARHPPLRRRRGRSGRVRLPLVPAVDRALSQAARRGRGRLVVRPGVRAGDADLLPAHRRQGAGPQELRDADGDRRRHAGRRPVRFAAAVPARLYAQPHHQPHRRRARPAAVPPPLPPAARLFRDARGRPDGGAGARAGNDPQLPDRPGPDLAARPRLHGGVLRRDVPLFGQADAGRARFDSDLRHRRRV